MFLIRQVFALVYGAVGVKMYGYQYRLLLLRDILDGNFITVAYECTFIFIGVSVRVFVLFIVKFKGNFYNLQRNYSKIDFNPNY